jgi:predicted dehydrogenase
MALRIGFVTIAHVHTGGLLWNCRNNPHVEVVGAWDFDKARLAKYKGELSLQEFETLDSLLDACDAVVIVSENKLHAEHCEAAARKGKHILCEKPLSTTEAESERILKAVKESGVKLSMCLPCRYHPSFIRLRERLKSGEIGALKGINATNRGRNPHGWFIVPELSGGGALMDHSVHVADLLWALLGKEPVSVESHIGYNIDNLDVDDTFVLTLTYEDGLFATIDGSWSRPKKYKTWGDVTMTLVGETGVLEMDMFGQELGVYTDEGDVSYWVAGYGSDMNQAMVDDFVQCVVENLPPPIPVEDGIRASRIVIEGYKNAFPPDRVKTLTLGKV